MSIIELHTKRAELVARRTKLIDQLAILKQRLVTTLPQSEFQKIETARQSIVHKIQQIDGQLTALNLKKHEAARAEHVEETPWIKELCDLRNNYQEFAADGTRSPTMRRMASEFVVKLNPIIRRALSRRGGGVIE